MNKILIKRILWWVCLCIAPLILISVELYHPAGFTKEPGMYQYLSIPDPNSFQNGHHALAYFGPKWWFTLHMIQTPLVGLVAIGLWLMMEGVEDTDGLVANIFAWLARISTFVFLIYYTVLDSIAGIGLGRTMVLAKGDEWTPEKVEVVQQLLNTVWGDG